ncbi:hypothetical protein TRIP_C20592 [Candidatus Zixiibacteriota bacterium]|nr:hypothetical protein TRIP_C20592 [candidate division Zixibacteria bacterium]
MTVSGKSDNIIRVYGVPTPGGAKMFRGTGKEFARIVDNFSRQEKF